MDNTRKPVIKGVIFDWAGVFCSPGEPFSHKKLKVMTGLSLEQMSEATETIQEKYYRGTISTEEFWKHVIQKLNISLTPKELSDAYLASYRIYPEMLELAQKVRSKVKTALLSNLTSEMMHEILRKHFIDRYFDHVLFSNEIGFIKPEKEAFDVALKHLGTKPNETLFIDDGKRNIDEAKILGFETILFTSPEESIEIINSKIN